MLERSGVVCGECEGKGTKLILLPAALGPEPACEAGTEAGADRALVAAQHAVCPVCGGAGMLWPLPQVRFEWKSEEVSQVVYECFLRGTIEALPINRFDGSLGFFVYLLEETLHEQVFLILGNRRHGLIAFHLRERTTGRPSQVILARQPLHRPRDYRPDQPLTLCRIRRRRSPRPQQPVPLHLADHLYDLWKTGPFEGVDLAGASWLCRAVRDTAAKLAWKIGSPVVAAYRNPREHIIALLSLDADHRWDKVGFIPEFRLREKIPFHLPVLTLGEDAARREEFPHLR